MAVDPMDPTDTEGGLPTTTEAVNDRTPSTCRYCTMTDQACRQAAGIKCCPDCDHRP